MGRATLIAWLIARDLQGRPAQAALLVLVIVAATTTLTLGLALAGARQRSPVAGRDPAGGVGHGLSRCRSRGNIVTCRTFAAPVSSAVHRSKPIANPPCGGMPCRNTCR